MIRIIANIFISIILLAGLIFGLAGCGNSEAEKAPEAAVYKKPKPEIGSTVVLASDAALKVDSYGTWDEMIFFKGNSLKVTDAFILYRGNIVKVLDPLDASDPWLYVETPCFVPPAPQGYISANAVYADFSSSEANQGYIKGLINQGVIINQGFIIDKAIEYSEPNEKSRVIDDSATGPVNIIKRENGWTFCGFTGGQEDGWIKEEQIRYYFAEPE